MSNDTAHWVVRFSDAADADLRGIAVWTSAQFGNVQAKAYVAILAAAVDALVDGPTIVGARPRPDIGRNVHSLHAARHGKRARHLVLFSPTMREGVATIEVLRILHDAMDLPRHFKIGDIDPA
ncbi:MAG: type II toxin-antitoxin system RelE/ParE family toxin [Alphaproteobacteria bacterium]|nr:type II toxin-antitoxin system RelE/ParE family toxin [Alphaproteobacteria bacterium]